MSHLHEMNLGSQQISLKLKNGSFTINLQLTLIKSDTYLSHHILVHNLIWYLNIGIPESESVTAFGMHLDTFVGIYK